MGWISYEAVGHVWVRVAQYRQTTKSSFMQLITIIVLNEKFDKFSSKM